ncbi:unnamed protein product [Rotaria sp. Silwood1]|nr:unnamed protein product [Rotaria sp. Silwood1]CAF0964289.1 unnamed protein product [Rotaria sp. Silwood1]CAF3391635.1 unnamed protein product [Rotaria sp. Silwood1]CAF3413940.1 unnamed protein product [Rotaria sp. Silwood1]CAF4873254.1 unnamed protein product [Rotaria sp. Silwood1]
MASSEEKNKLTVFDKDHINQNRSKKKNIQIRLNDINDIDKYVSNLTSEKINDIIKTFVQVVYGVLNVKNIETKLTAISKDCPPLRYKHLIYELYYNDENLLKKYFFMFLSILINKHYNFIEANSDLNNINLCHLLRLIEKKNIFGKFELINDDHLDLSFFFALIGTFLIKIISHRKITTEDLCLMSSILQDDIISKNISNWKVLKHFIQLFRTILHIEFVTNIYFELINDEIQSTNILDADRFKELIDDAKDLKDNSIMFGALLVIMLHEFFHVLRRTIIEHAFNPFYERTPPRKIASRNNIEMAEGGTQLEDCLFGIVIDSIGYLDANFLLNSENWINHNHEEFKEKFNSARTHDLQENKKHNRWIIPSNSRTINDDMEQNAPTTTTTTTPTTSSERWAIPQCALSAPFFRIDK